MSSNVEYVTTILFPTIIQIIKLVMYYFYTNHWLCCGKKYSIGQKSSPNPYEDDVGPNMRGDPAINGPKGRGNVTGWGVLAY